MYKSGSPYLVCEELADVVRQRLPEAVSCGLAGAFDYEGAMPVVLGTATVVRSLADRLLGHAIRHTAAGHVFFLVRVEARAIDRCELVLRVADTSAGMAADATAALNDALAGRSVELGELVGRVPDLLLASTLCRSCEGAMSVESVEGEGFVAQARVPLRCLAPLDDESLGDAEGAALWLIGDPPLTHEPLVRRFQRHGWSVRQLAGVEEAHDLLDGRASEARPALVLATEHYGVRMPALEELRERLAAPTMVAMLVLQTSALNAGSAVVGIELHALPLSPRRLRHYTALARHSGLRPSGDTEPAALAGLKARPCVLVVDDDEVNRVLAVQALRLLGYEVELASSGAEAIAACRRSAPVAVLMDVEMPGTLDGIAATRALRALQRTGELAGFPIIAATGLASAASRAACRAAGMDGFLRKPLHAEGLRDELRRCAVPGA